MPVGTLRVKTNRTLEVEQRLTVEDVREIRAKLAAGDDPDTLAKAYEVRRRVIRRIGYDPK